MPLLTTDYPRAKFAGYFEIIHADTPALAKTCDCAVNAYCGRVYTFAPGPVSTFVGSLEEVETAIRTRMEELKVA